MLDPDNDFDTALPNSHGRSRQRPRIEDIPLRPAASHEVPPKSRGRSRQRPRIEDAPLRPASHEPLWEDGRDSGASRTRRPANGEVELELPDITRWQSQRRKASRFHQLDDDVDDQEASSLSATAANEHGAEARSRSVSDQQPDPCDRKDGLISTIRHIMSPRSANIAYRCGIGLVLVIGGASAVAGVVTRNTASDATFSKTSQPSPPQPPLSPPSPPEPPPSPPAPSPPPSGGIRPSCPSPRSIAAWA